MRYEFDCDAYMLTFRGNFGTCWDVEVYPFKQDLEALEIYGVACEALNVEDLIAAAQEIMNEIREERNEFQIIRDKELKYDGKVRMMKCFNMGGRR